MRLSRSKSAEAGLACAVVLTALALAATDSVAVAQSASAVSHHQTVYEKTIDPGAARAAAAPAFPTELVRFLRPARGGRLRWIPPTAYAGVGGEPSVGVLAGATSLAPATAVGTPPPVNPACNIDPLWGLARYGGGC
jgi:hypothetical protein